MRLSQKNEGQDLSPTGMRPDRVTISRRRDSPLRYENSRAIDMLLEDAEELGVNPRRNGGGYLSEK
jgi:hypothetical protein